MSNFIPSVLGNGESAGSIRTKLNQNFQLIAETISSIGFVWQGTYNPSTQYVKGDVVYYGSALHIAKTNTINLSPDNTSAWDFLLDGPLNDGASKENIVNKSINVITDQASNVKYPSVKAVYDWVTSAFAKYSGDADFYKYSIVRTVASGNMTVALKNYEGNDPTSTKPVKIQIGDTVRTITSAVSVTALGGNNGNWMNLASTELVGKEVDLFCYLEFETTSSSVGIIISRIPSANILGDFVFSGTNEKGLWLSIVTNTPNSPVVNIGRFNVIFSGSAPSYTWSIPATSVIVNRPIYETRTLSGGSQTGWTANNLLFYYTINGDRVDFSFDANGISNSTSSYITLPFSAKMLMAHDFALGLTYDNGADSTTPGRADLYGQYITLYKDTAYGAWTASGAKIIRGQGHYFI